MTNLAHTAHRLASPISAASLPAQSGIGLKAQHYKDIHDRNPDIGWLEVHSENYMCAGGPTKAWLNAMRDRYPLSLHGVGLSLGSAGPLDKTHLKRLVELERRIEPGSVSEHLSWSIADGIYLNDLIALPYTEEALEIFSTHVVEMQDALKRRVLIENPSSYLRYEHSVISEPEFLLNVIDKSDCAVLLDVNNVYVSAMNHGFDPIAYVDQIPADAIGEIHLGGHSEVAFDDRILRIDDHGSQVCDAVWALYEHVIKRTGPKPTLIEWDSNIPELDVLLDEAAKADRILARASATEEVRHAALV
ncbi:DUF692 domain-containing protein [Magnetovibrio sp.]|uniref:MNIO family bufferin maturase n=1 Tax=Magnetovibrio sp. TaxID=2024836 RepID=UPI002F93BDB3